MSTALKKEYAKAKKVLHPNSRKTIAIAKRAKKISNRQKSKMGGLIKQNLIGEKMLWMQEHMEPDVCPYTLELTARLLETYIARNDDELEQIAIKHSIGGRKNRQHASREDVIRMTKEREVEEYNTCGIEIPDILSTAQCEMLKKWDGDLRFLQNFKFRRFGKKHLIDATKKANKQTKPLADDVKSKNPSKPENITDDATQEVSEDTETIENTNESIENTEDTSEQNVPNESAMEID